MEGIHSFACSRPAWTFEVIPPELATLPALRKMGAVGVIGGREQSRWIRAVRSAGIALVPVTNRPVPPPAVGFDEQANAALAAAHFLERGFENFAFLATVDDLVTHNYLKGFRRRLASAGFDCDEGIFFDPSGQRWRTTEPRLLEQHIQDWLGVLRRPVGILATKEMGGMALTHVCRHLGLCMPDDVSVVGLQYDDILCELSTPTVSSVRPADVRVGFEAAAMLDRVMAGCQDPAEHLLLPPDGLTVRQSSDTYAVGDPHLAKALSHIANHAHERICVRDILGVVPLSRRALEQRFHRFRGRTPAQEIRSVRIERAKTLLRKTDLSISEIAYETGFSEPTRLANTFQREVGISPRVYRRLRRRLRSTPDRTSSGFPATNTAVWPPRDSPRSSPGHTNALADRDKTFSPKEAPLHA